MRPGTLFICKRRTGPRIGAPHQISFGNAISADSAQTAVSGCPDRAMLSKTPFSGMRDLSYSQVMNADLRIVDSRMSRVVKKIPRLGRYLLGAAVAILASTI